MKGQSNNTLGAEKEKDILGNIHPLTTSSRWLRMAFSSVGVCNADLGLINSILNVKLRKYQSLVILHLEG